jgi:hypothetical protein
MASKNTNLHSAKKAKNDEFYTQLSDIEKEMRHYKDFFKGKVVYCNCDDARESNFFKYFSMNFEHLGLKKLITTGFKESGKGVVLIYEGDKNGNRIVEDSEIEVRELTGNGDFRSEECIQYLKESDVVVTNPPFSLFREFVTLIIEKNKKFLIIGNKNAVGSKEIFPLVKKNLVWLGYTSPSKFIQLESDEMKNMTGLTRWFTNLEIPKREEKIDTRIEFAHGDSKGWYQKYDNYDAINVSETRQIPMDYEKVMGVPITFLDKYNPKQFKIVGFRKGDDGLDLKVNGKDTYCRILIQKM